MPVGPDSDEPADPTTETPTAERVVDPQAPDAADLCDVEWQAWLREQALKELQLEVKAQHYQIFHLLVVEQQPRAEVAAKVGRSRAQIYGVKHRLARKLKKIVRRLEQKLG